MKKFIHLILCILSLSMGNILAQSDSLTLINGPWVRDTLEEFVVCTVHFDEQNYFHSNQFISILEIPTDAKVALRFAHAAERTPTTTIAQQHNALAAINGSFFDMDLHNPVCYLRIDGVELGVNTPGRDTVNRKYYQYGAILLHDGRATIIQTDSARLWECTLPDSNIMTSGPLLMYHGENLPMRNDLSFVNKRHNRTAVGIKPDGTLLLLTVDGRTRQSEGMTLDELTATLRWLGCCEAINLDGGGSTTMYVRDYPDNGIVNHPSDNGRFDHNGERGVSNILMLIDKEE